MPSLAKPLLSRAGRPNGRVLRLNILALSWQLPPGLGSHSPSASQLAQAPHDDADVLMLHETPWSVYHLSYMSLSLDGFQGLCCRTAQVLPCHSSSHAQIGLNSGSGGHVKQLPRSWQRKGQREMSMSVVMLTRARAEGPP